jgi:hypothetical protein
MIPVRLVPKHSTGCALIETWSLTHIVPQVGWGGVKDRIHTVYIPYVYVYYTVRPVTVAYSMRYWPYRSGSTRTENLAFKERFN